MSPSRLPSADLRVIGMTLLYTAFLLVLPRLVPREALQQLFSETGPFEILSIVAWLFLAAVTIWHVRPLTVPAGAFAALSVLLAAREADLHKAFTADSLLKTNYYRHSLAPFEEKLLAGLAAIVFIGLLLYGGWIVARFLFLRGGWRTRPGLWLLAGSALVVAGKLLDRAPAVLAEDFGIGLPQAMQLYTLVLEEGLEMIHPLIIAWSVWIAKRERHFLA